MKNTLDRLKIKPSKAAPYWQTLPKPINQLENPNYIAEGYELNTTDFKLQLDKIKKSNVKFGYLIAFSSKEFADILKQTKELDLDIQWFSYSGIETRETLELAMDSADGIIYSYPTYDANGTLYANFQRKYSAKYKSWADIYTVTSYDGVYLVAKVMEEYGTTAIDIQKGLRSIDQFDGIFGNIKLSNAVGKQCVDRKLMWKKIENNQYKIAD